MFPLMRICSSISKRSNCLRATSTALRNNTSVDQGTIKLQYSQPRGHSSSSLSLLLLSSPFSITTKTKTKTFKATKTTALAATALSIAVVHSFSTQATVAAALINNNNIKMPQPPYQYCPSVVGGDDSTATQNLLDLTCISNRISEFNNKQQTAYDTSRALQVAINKAANAIEFQHPKQNDILDELKLSILSSIHKDGGDGSGKEEEEEEMLQQKEGAGEAVVVDRHPRLANLQNRVEDYVRLLAYDQFLKTGTLISPKQTSSFATDEEYLAGACMGLCHDLARYGLGRATARDVDSVVAARNLLQAIFQYLLRFDFRNGYLRRKYDGTKYALKSLETILYELSVTGATLSEEEKEADPPLTPADELDAIRLRVAHRDELRETLIKKCRDGQKAAKQAIYALHRGDAKQSSKLLKMCENCILNDLLPIIEEEPPLRQGSFSNVMEEYAEAKLFFVWLHGNDDNDGFKGDEQKNQKDKQVSGILLKPDDFTNVPLEPDEYLGGVCDLTGEIGRFAVQRGTVRDLDGVKRCLEANAAVQDAIQSMDERLPGGVTKKLDQLRRSVQKIERMMYEMSLSEAAGGRKVDSSEDIKVATANDE